jgi:hypothetical protein
MQVIVDDGVNVTEFEAGVTHYNLFGRRALIEGVDNSIERHAGFTDRITPCSSVLSGTGGASIRRLIGYIPPLTCPAIRKQVIHFGRNR